jgi:hypothetical protein
MDALCADGLCPTPQRQRMLRVLCTVKWHCRKDRFLWRAACARLDVRYNENRPAQRHGKPDEHGNCHTVTFVCVGTAADLEELVGESFVVRRQNVLTGTVAVKGMGSGPKKRQKSRGRKLGKLGKGHGPMTADPKDKTTAVDTMGHVQENDVLAEGNQDIAPRTD